MSHFNIVAALETNFIYSFLELIRKTTLAFLRSSNRSLWRHIFSLDVSTLFVAQHECISCLYLHIFYFFVVILIHSNFHYPTLQLSNASNSNILNFWLLSTHASKHHLDAKLASVPRSLSFIIEKFYYRASAIFSLTQYDISSQYRQKIICHNYIYGNEPLTPYVT